MSKSEWSRDQFGNLVQFKTGKLNSNAAVPNGRYPFFTCSQETFRTDTCAFDTECVLLAGNNANGIYPLKYFKGKFDAYQRTYVITPLDFSRLHTRFLYYAMRPMLEHLRSISTGAATKFVTLTILNGLTLQLPPLTIQRKIASILSAYDDLIENNTRRIAILEEMAQAIYREWFVNFRFPGHENLKLVDSALGKIPEGWCERKLEEVTTKIGSGATPTGGKNAYKDSGITLIRSLNVYNFNFHDDGLAFIDEQQAGQLDNVTVERHDILLNITGASVARCCMVRADLLPARVNQHVAIVRANKIKVDPFFLLSTINSDRHKKQILALAQGGATREALTKMTIQKYEILLPDAVTIRRFGTIAEGIFEQREILQRKNENLRTTRDLLLSKLISGQLDVEELDIDAQKSFNGEPQA